MNGVVNLLKPPDMTSQSAVTRLKRILDVRKAGHAGTLDPGAAGVLPVCVGRATKLVRFLMDGTKEYIAELTLGTSTDTLDSWGIALERSRPHPVSIDAVESACRKFTGKIEQVPPAYSAIKVKGRPMYSYAREGVEVPRQVRSVVVKRFDLLRGYGAGPFLFRIECSKGTYVRVLLADVAAELGQVGCTTLLVRTRVGPFQSDTAWTFDEIEDEVSRHATGFLIAPQDAVRGTGLVLPPHLYDILASGGRIDPGRVHGLALREEEIYRVFCRDEFFGIGEYDGKALALTARIKL